ncbi:CRISPR-associated protein Csx3 [Candidatus Parcubacteria bacterium]|nr:MAG: CRISPR-associated protein Csx3 [Candidatus Parcubacteria bacterium]
MQFTTETRSDFTIISFELDGPIEPSQLSQIDLPKVDLKKGVVLSGRGPVWLYAALVHELHPAAWVATHDPRLGAVVVMSHTPGRKLGEVIEL